MTMIRFPKTSGSNPQQESNVSDPKKKPLDHDRIAKILGAEHRPLTEKEAEQVVNITTPPAAEIKRGGAARAEKTAMKITDPEAQAIARMGSILTGLDEAARRRVLAWANDRFDARPAMKPLTPAMLGYDDVYDQQTGKPAAWSGEGK